MTPDELRIAAAILLQRGISQGRGPYSALARRIERPLSTVNNWLSGRTPIPAQVARHIAMETVVAAALAYAKENFVSLTEVGSPTSINLLEAIREYEERDRGTPNVR